MKYHDVHPIDRSAAIKLFSSHDSVAICNALVSLAFHDPDWGWVQSQCLAKLGDRNPDIAGTAVTCLGHLARIHHKLDLAVVLPALENAKKNVGIKGRVEDAMDDIHMYIANGAHTDGVLSAE